ncbi:hypothetical protein BCR33DRAFT_222169 [Rhizoclosmatium globosum]|uniref:Uncharacterized protein n=1 Tax=Rhizoclosmatium globosum TaxID=329046 RepID=A0A1Y2CDR2_9FUNG|nr:hypothetical protein BCR33DRAFT_222169 [Rhizoclosmatium globosum]|eukprot:ORY44445.1 hypothetical protein BCR33DRAFT_222169 [Rhizoclosmatium globosum]
MMLLHKRLWIELASEEQTFAFPMFEDIQVEICGTRVLWHSNLEFERMLRAWMFSFKAIDSRESLGSKKKPGDLLLHSKRYKHRLLECQNKRCQKFWQHGSALQSHQRILNNYETTNTQLLSGCMQQTPPSSHSTLSQHRDSRQQVVE